MLLVVPKGLRVDARWHLPIFQCPEISWEIAGRVACVLVDAGQYG